MARDQPFAFQSWIVAAVAVLGALATPLIRSAPADEAHRPLHANAANHELGARELARVTAGQAFSTSEAPASERLQRLLRETSRAAGISGAANSLEAGIGNVLSRGGQVTGVVVQLPDPTQGNLRLYYDQSLGALREAAAAAGYVQGQFDLPWQEGEYTVASDAPGLLLFSKHDSERLQILVAILVPESPVLGSTTARFDAALELARIIANSHDEDLRVLGPFFSGTALPLRSALERSNRVPYRLRRTHVVTGTATSQDVDRIFERTGPEIDFRRVVPTDKQLVDWVREQVPGRGGQPLKLAWLIELGTGYGEAGMSDARNGEDAVFGFPIHISEVRAEHEAVSAQQAELFPSLRRTLGLKLDPSEARESDVPNTLSTFTRNSDDLSLSRELRGVCDSRAHYVVVQATDPIDVIFLTQQLRRYCQTSVVVTLGYDQLYVHPDLTRVMSGALVASPYAPSLSIARLAHHADSRTFPSSSIQGFFNALTLLLGATDDHLFGVRCNGLALPQACKPALFVAQVTSTGFVPLSADAVETAQLFEGDISRGVKLPASTTARAVAWPVLFLCLWHLWLRVTRRAPFEVVSRSWSGVRAARLLVADISLLIVATLVSAPLWSVVTRPQFAATGWKRIAVEIIAISSLLVVGCLALATLVSLLHSFFGWRRARRLVRSVGSDRPPHGDAQNASAGARPRPLALPKGARVALRVTGIFTALAAVALALAAWQSFSDCLMPLLRPPSDSAQRVAIALRWFRMFDPLAMSSAVPFLLIAIGVYAWSLFALSRLARLERFPKRLTKSLLTLPDLPRLELHLTCTELRFPWVTTRYWGAPILGFAFCCWCFCTSLWPTFEGRAFDYGYSTAFCILLAFGTCELVRFVTLSGRLLRLLRDLAAEPMIDAYDRIASKVSGSFGLQLSARAPEPQDFQISVLTARTLTNLAPADGKRKLQPAAETLASGMKALNASPERASSQRTVHTALFRVAGVLHALLVQQWEARARCPALDEALSDVSRKDLLPLGDHARSPTALVLMGALPSDVFLWLRAAEDFVALRSSTLIYQVLHELRETLVFALGAGMLLALSVASYPFQPARFLTVCTWSAVICVVGVGLWRMLALERNEVLSRLGGTRPDHLEWNAAFVQQLALYVALPLATAVFGLFPELGEHVATVLAPVAQFLRSGP